jgi:acetyl esterase/lipase
VKHKAGIFTLARRSIWLLLASARLWWYQTHIARWECTQRATRVNVRPGRFNGRDLSRSRAMPRASGVVSFRMPPRRTLLRCAAAMSSVIAGVVVHGAVVASHAEQAAPGLMRPADIGKLPMPPADDTLKYGQDPAQIGELRLPPGPGPHPIVVLVHGGCWMPIAGRYLAAMGDELKKDGIASWNIGYRRIGQPGGGWPGTYLDVGHAIDYLRTIAGRYRLDLSHLAVLGHSAGGHLAMWAGTRHRLAPASPLYIANPLRVRGVINLAGTIDMSANIAHMEQKCRGPVVTSLMGGTMADVPERYKAVSAQTHLPLGVTQVLIWGDQEDFVPQPLVEQYAAAATRAGDRARLILVPASGHFETASPFTTAWPVLRDAVRSVLRD